MVVESDPFLPKKGGVNRQVRGVRAVDSSEKNLSRESCELLYDERRQKIYFCCGKAIILPEKRGSDASLLFFPPTEPEEISTARECHHGEREIYQI